MKKRTVTFIFTICLLLAVSFKVNAGTMADSSKPEMKSEYIYYYPGSTVGNDQYTYPVVFFKKSATDKVRHTVGENVSVETVGVVSESEINFILRSSEYGYMHFKATLTPLKYTDFGPADTTKPFDGLYAITPPSTTSQRIEPLYIVFTYNQALRKIRFINLKTGEDVTRSAYTQNSKVIIENGNKVVFNPIAPAPLSGVYSFIAGDSSNYNNYMPVMDVLGKYYDQVVYK